jgi:hypothetical protein
MKHSTTRALYAYWDKQRADAQAPDRRAMEPGPIRHLIGDTFVLACDRGARFPVRVVGTRVCALVGRDLKGQDFLDLWNASGRREIEDLIGISTSEGLATVAGVTAQTDTQLPVYLELLLLPFAPSSLAPQCITGSLVPLTVPERFGHTRLETFTLTTWRHQGHRLQTIRQRAVRKLALARGFMVYEGLRGEV